MWVCRFPRAWPCDDRTHVLGVDVLRDPWRGVRAWDSSRPHLCGAPCDGCSCRRMTLRCHGLLPRVSSRSSHAFRASFVCLFAACGIFSSLRRVPSRSRVSRHETSSSHPFTTVLRLCRPGTVLSVQVCHWWVLCSRRVLDERALPWQMGRFHGSCGTSPLCRRVLPSTSWTPLVVRVLAASSSRRMDTERLLCRVVGGVLRSASSVAASFPLAAVA